MTNKELVILLKNLLADARAHGNYVQLYQANVEAAIAVLEAKPLAEITGYMARGDAENPFYVGNRVIELRTLWQDNKGWEQAMLVRVAIYGVDDV